MEHPLSAILTAQERTAAWLARKAGKSPSYVVLVMQGKRTPSADFKMRAAVALGVPESLIFPAPAEPEAVA